MVFQIRKGRSLLVFSIQVQASPTTANNTKAWWWSMRAKAIPTASKTCRKIPTHWPFTTMKTKTGNLIRIFLAHQLKLMASQIMPEKDFLHQVLALLKLFWTAIKSVRCGSGKFIRNELRLCLSQQHFLLEQQ